MFNVSFDLFSSDDIVNFEVNGDRNSVLLSSSHSKDLEPHLL